MARQELPEAGLQNLLSSSEPEQTKEIAVRGCKPFTIKYRAMSWLDKSACVAKSTEFFMNEANEPQTRFHINVYFREALKMMIVEFPPAPLSDKVLDGLSPEIGQQLQEIIPSPLGEEAANLAEGSEKPSKARKKTRSSSATQSS